MYSYLSMICKFSHYDMCDTNIISFICIARMDFSESFHIEGDAGVERYDEKPILSKTFQ